MIEGAPVPAPLTRDPLEAVQDDGVRVAEYARWRAFARGDAQWTKRPAAGEDQPVYNYARALIRKVASYVYAGPVKFSVGAPDETPPAETAINEAAQRLGLAELDLQLAIEAATIGDAVTKVTWDAVAGDVRVVAVDPASVQVAWSPDQGRTPQAVTHTYELNGWALRAILPNFNLEPNRPYPVVEQWTADRWFIKCGDLAAERPNPYGWVPYCFVSFNRRPRQFWGQSDLVDLADVQRDFNQEIRTLTQIMRLSGAPIAVFENVQGLVNIHTKPGARWELPQDAKAYLLDLLAGGGVDLHIKYLQELRQTLHDLSETPRTAFGDSGRALSGAALEVEIQPLVQRVRRQRTALEPFYLERNRRILDLLDRFSMIDVGPERITTTVWPPILPSDDESVVRNQVQLVAAGIRSKYTANVELGAIDPEAELERVAAERAAEVADMVRIEAAKAAAPQEEPGDGKRTEDLHADE